MTTAAEGTRMWQDAKHIKKRTKFLLDNLSIIPTDITFRVGPEGSTQDISAHKLILALGSSVFHSMFYGELREKQEIIPVPDVEPDVFRILMKFLYSEEHEGITAENVMECIYCAKKYLILRLLKHCREFAQDNLTPELACSFLLKAMSLDEENIGLLASIMISSQTVKVFDSPSFLEMPVSLIRSVLSREDLSVDENEIYLALRKWVIHGAECEQDMEDAFAHLIDCIRFPLMAPSEIANGPAKDGVLTDAELMKVYQYKFAEDKPAIRFSTVVRTPRPEPYFVSMDLVAHFGEEGEDTDAEEINFGRIRLEVRCDVAPLASRVFLLLCNDDQKFTVTFGDVEFCRHSGEEDGGANDTFSTENRLLANLPGMMSFVLKPGESEPRTKELQICHPDKKANRNGLNGAVFAKVVCGMESLKHVDSFRDAIWDREKEHPFNDAMPAVYFYFDNVTVDAEFCGVEEL